MQREIYMRTRGQHAEQTELVNLTDKPWPEFYYAQALQMKQRPFTPLSHTLKARSHVSPVFDKPLSSLSSQTRTKSFSIAASALPGDLCETEMASIVQSILYY